MEQLAKYKQECEYAKECIKEQEHELSHGSHQHPAHRPGREADDLFIEELERISRQIEDPEVREFVKRARGRMTPSQFNEYLSQRAQALNRQQGRGAQKK
jgi:hypothetical protein